MNKEDYFKLCEPWPKGSFDHNDPVLVSMEYIDMELTVERVDTQVKLDIDRDVKNNLDRQGIAKYERAKRKEIIKENDKEDVVMHDMNRLTIKAKDLSFLKKILRDGVDLNWTSKNHKVKPSLKKARMCYKCCGYDHNAYSCHFDAKCGYCSSTTHDISACPKPYRKCFWCHSTQHSAGSDDCMKQYKMNCELNAFFIDFMISEGIKTTPCEVLGIRRPEGLTSDDLLVDEDANYEKNANLTEIVAEMFNQIKAPIENELNSLKLRVSENETKIKGVSDEIKMVKSELSTEIKNLHKEMKTEIKTLQAEVKLEVKQLDARMTQNFTNIDMKFEESRNQTKELGNRMDEKFQQLLSAISGK